MDLVAFYLLTMVQMIAAGVKVKFKNLLMFMRN